VKRVTAFSIDFSTGDQFQAGGLTCGLLLLAGSTGIVDRNRGQETTNVPHVLLWCTSMAFPGLVMRWHHGSFTAVGKGQVVAMLGGHAAWGV
jgi:hypothetical protein